MDSKDSFIYLRGLNGIRAIAAIGVMISHLNLSLKDFNIFKYSLFGFKAGKAVSWNLGEQGVTMFFVLSGFLITYLLKKEYEKKSTIKIKSFYMRRILRIWPLYFLYLFSAILLVYLISNTIPSIQSLGCYTFFLANVPFILGISVPACNHLWSIAVEEQFYLFWPLFFLKVPKIKKVLVVLIVVQALLRIMLWKLYPFSVITLLCTTNRFDCMMFGGLIAILMLENHRIIRIMAHKYLQIIAWLIILIHIINFEIINSIISMLFIAFAVGVIICGQIKSEVRVINLENKFFNFFGKYSFGIYVYHPLIIYILSKTGTLDFIENELIKLVVVFVFIIILTILIAYLSYEYFENKFLKLKTKFSVIESSNTLKLKLSK